MSTFGERLRSHRERKGVTGWKIEKETGISRSNLSSIEKGRRPASDDVIGKLASVEELGLSVDRLKAWQRLDGASDSEKMALLEDILFPFSGSPAGVFELVRDVFMSLDKKKQIELMGDNLPILLAEARRLEEEEK